MIRLTRNEGSWMLVDEDKRVVTFERGALVAQALSAALCGHDNEYTLVAISADTDLPSMSKHVPVMLSPESEWTYNTGEFPKIGVKCWLHFENGKPSGKVSGPWTYAGHVGGEDPYLTKYWENGQGLCVLEYDVIAYAPYHEQEPPAW